MTDKIPDGIHINITADNSNCSGIIQPWEIVNENGFHTPKELPEICIGCQVATLCLQRRMEAIMDYHPDHQED